MQSGQVDAAQSARKPETLRIPLDTKAKVKIGELSRGGLARGAAADHDVPPPADAGLAPAGILEVPAQQMDIAFGTSRDTSDVSADALEWRRTSRRDG